MNGIEAARRIRKLSPESKILFVSQESSAILREALGAGASGYIVKTDAGRELLEAVSAVLRGEQFVGRRFAGHDFTGASNAGASESLRSNSVFAPLEQSMEITRRHRGGGSMETMQVFWMVSLSLSGPLSRPEIPHGLS